MQESFQKLNNIIDIISKINYTTLLNISFKNTLRKFDKTELFADIKNYRRYLYDFISSNSDDILAECRIKATQSMQLKYDKYYPSTELDKCFNDILGIMLIVDNYNDFKEFVRDNTKLIDMSNGKRVDDGYRAIHLYYQTDRKHYPIEIQLVTQRDRIFNEWLHIFVYKYKDREIGIKLKEIYDNGLITNEEDFIKYLKEMNLDG